jgi:S-adenosyl-L-methionine hydrolase (adenosine-forming)
MKGQDKNSPPIITLLTDFGGGSGYPAAMKGVILSRLPGASLVDISHEVPPQDIPHASFLLKMVWPFFPKGTVHIVVVDPGVGSRRRILTVEAAGRMFLAPDNGVLAYIFHSQPDLRVHTLTNPELFLPRTSYTFEGRDRFAPAAAALASGLPLEETGPAVLDFNRGNVPLPARKGNRIKGEIIHIDHFGNCISNIDASMLEDTSCSISVGKLTIPTILRTYCHGKDDKPLALIGSHDYLEIALPNGDAGREIGIERGDSVLVTLETAAE